MSFNGPTPIKYKDSQAFPFDRMASIWKEILKGLPLSTFNAVARVHPNTHLTFNNEIFPNADILEFHTPRFRARLAQHFFKAALHLFRNPPLMERIHVDDLFLIAASHPLMKSYLINDRNKVWFPGQALTTLQISLGRFGIDLNWWLLNIKGYISNELWNLLLEPSNADNIEDQVKRATLYKDELKLAVSRLMSQPTEIRIIESCQRLHPSFALVFLTEITFINADCDLFNLCHDFETAAQEVVRRIGAGTLPISEHSKERLLNYCVFKYASVRQYILQSPHFSYLTKMLTANTGFFKTIGEYTEKAFTSIFSSKPEKEKPKTKLKTSEDDFQLKLSTLNQMAENPEYFVPRSILNTVRSYGTLETQLLALELPDYANTVNRSRMVFDLLGTMVESLDPLKVSRMPESQPLALHEIARLSVPVLPSAKRRKIVSEAEPVAQPPLLSSFSLHSAPVAAGANLPEVTDDDLYNLDPVEPEITDDDLYNVGPSEESSKKRKRGM